MFRSLKDWRRVLDLAGCCLEEVIPFFHPIDAPVDAWRLYDDMTLTKAGLRLQYRAPKASQTLMRVAARQALRANPYVAPGSSTINILAGHAA
jgi:hypothetical protein